MRKQISITLEEEVLEKLDEERGSIHRSTFINDILRRELFGE